MAELPIAPVRRIIRDAGADRISDDACVALAEILEDKATAISEKAILLANHAGRKTVQIEDIELSVDSE